MERKFKDRISEHIGYIRTKKIDKITSAHFNSTGHSLGNMSATILEKVKSEDIFYRKEDNPSTSGNSTPFLEG